MDFLVLTKSTTFILGPIASLLGYIMNGIFEFCSLFGVQNIGLCIILFTLIVKLLMLPMTVKQQKYSKLTSVMNPELQAVQAKYKGKQDQESMQKMQRETQAVYDKYGASPMGGCLQLLIQMPILFALYKVIYNIPAYVTGIKDQFMGIVDVAVKQPGFATKIAELATSNQMSATLDYSGATVESKNLIVDLFYKFDMADWNQFYTMFDGIQDKVGQFVDKIMHMNSFLGGINLAEAPGWKLSWALLIPILAGLSQWLSTKLMSQPAPSSDGENNTMGSTMKMMNTIMPLTSVFFCVIIPTGVGLYWVASSVFQVIQQLAINAYMDKLNVNELIAKSVEKKNKKRAKKGLPPLKQNANMKNMEHKTFKQLEEESRAKAASIAKQPVKKVDNSEYYNSRSKKPGSISSKANMVNDYNKKHGGK
ncbi:YidC/Oxa1 family membrane protein insertase [Lachnotalea sp. AF33-28]|uniref:YidC/Oxa1 family membrane protein insertase n=1 Tax=Lachnotalea sp. AF33-28 TaxID=2292046 RepID=UPI000E50503D|nr:YidC/Oxa1 family membrane protein insertase [Lachnotalea sp. AF33-28]RHP33876.1 membrane protein insertase YidC [Lachnotalea sp. AF33-28]